MIYVMLGVAGILALWGNVEARESPFRAGMCIVLATALMIALCIHIGVLK